VPVFSSSPRRSPRALRLGGATVAAAVLVTACGAGGSTSTTSSTSAGGASGASAGCTEPLNAIFGPGGKAGGKDVTISDGMVLALSGPGLVYGGAMKKAADLAAEQIAKACGPTFKIATGDHQNGDPGAGLREYQRLVSQDKIQMLQTSYGAPSEAIAPKLANDKVLAFNGGGASPGQIGKDNLWLTRMIFVLDPTPGGLAWLQKNNPNAKKLAVVGQKENGSEVQEQIVPALWPKLQSGGSIVVNEYAPIGTTNFDSIVAKIKASGAEAVFTTTFSDDMGYFVKQLRSAGVTVPVLGIDVSDNFFKVAGASVKNVFAAAEYYDVKNPSPFNKIFVDGWTAKYGEAPRDIYGANYYEMLFIWWELVKRVRTAGGDPTDIAQLQKALVEKPTFTSLYGGDASTSGTMTFDTATHTISKPMVVMQLNAGGDVKVIGQIKRIDYTKDAPASALVGD
jgi:ABC-type branched-subunit amino acid transport system substrate-binding protein